MASMQTIAPSAKRSGTTNHEVLNHKGSAGLIFVDATASSGDGTEDLDINIDIQDPASGKWLTLFDDSPFSNGGTGTVIYGIGTGIDDTQTSLQAVQEVPLPYKFRVQSVVQQGGSGTVDYTYSVGLQITDT